MDTINQIEMAIKNHFTGGLIGEEKALRAAVLVPLVQINHSWHVLFEVRAYHLTSQPGDICFPGGKIDATDPTPLDAALRETSEELGIGRDLIQPIGSLNLYVPSSQLIIYPFVGKLLNHAFSINKEEVDHTFTIPLDWLLTHQPEKHVVSMAPEPGADFPYDKISQGRKYAWRTRKMEELFYHYKEHSVWGMTARILTHFLNIIKADSSNSPDSLNDL